MVFLGEFAGGFPDSHEQVSRGEAIHLPPKTTSFKRGRNAYRVRAVSSAAEQDYWLAERRKPVARLPVDYSGENTAAANTISLT